ncbi:type IV secretory system conjugative DNA transfer family protein [Mycobacteroides abscessus]|uniref:type IV secretory system conjugative DNA transfer family protein n=1 Tax=Mycobacteroides abscessus TaxID=36809 RepID=UPI0005E142E9|nr:type IV secretory system conjugative DNA transfer family protein [Mycobacteroides abscessus]CPW94785.1 Uncharacterised protein [Mycobacteroides abscessus]
MSTLIIGGGGSGKTTYAKELTRRHLADGGRAIILTTAPEEWEVGENLTVTTDVAMVRELVTALVVYRQSAKSPTPVLFVIDGADKFDAELTSPLWQAVERVTRFGRDTSVSFVATAQRTDGVVPNSVIDFADVLVTGYPTAPREHVLFPLGSYRHSVRSLFEQEAPAVLIDRGSGEVIPWNLEPAKV